MATAQQDIVEAIKLNNLHNALQRGDFGRDPYGRKSKAAEEQYAASGGQARLAELMAIPEVYQGVVASMTGNPLVSTLKTAAPYLALMGGAAGLAGMLGTPITMAGSTLGGAAGAAGAGAGAAGTAGAATAAQQAALTESFAAGLGGTGSGLTATNVIAGGAPLVAAAPTIAATASTPTIGGGTIGTSFETGLGVPQGTLTTAVPSAATGGGALGTSFEAGLGLPAGTLPTASAPAAGASALGATGTQAAQTAAQQAVNAYGGTYGTAGQALTAEQLASLAGNPEALAAYQAAGMAASGTPWLDYVSTGLGLVQGIQGVTGGTGLDAAQIQNMVDPFAPYRGQYAQQLNQLMAAPSTVTTLPGYQFLQQQGQQGVQRALAAQGRTVSGVEQLALQQQDQRLANQFYNEQYQKLAQLSGATASPAGGGTAGAQTLASNQQAQQAGWGQLGTLAAGAMTPGNPVYNTISSLGWR